MKITKQEFDTLYSDDVTKKQYDAVIAKIDQRFGEIIITLMPNFHKNRQGWFDYDNCSYDSDVSGGYFDPQAYQERIAIGGKWDGLPAPFEYEIPTKWLWEDFQEDFDAQIKAYKEAEALQKAKLAIVASKKKESKLQIIEAIKSKLTPEELKLVSFKV